MAEYCTYLQAGSVPATMDRLILDLITKGNSGVGGGGELKCSASASDLSVNVQPGRMVVPTGVLTNGIPVEGSYVYANTAIKNLALAGASGTQWRTDLLVVHIYDNILFTDGSNVGQLEIVTGANSGTNPAPAPTPSFSHYVVVAQIRLIPGSTVPALIVDQRVLANPRTKESILSVIGGSNSDASSSSPTYGDWPLQATWTVARPTWATSAELELVLSNILGITAGPTQTAIRAYCDAQLTASTYLSFTVDQLNIRLPPFVLLDTIAAVPANTNNVWKVQATRLSGTGALRFDNIAVAKLKLKYVEGLT